MTSTMLNKGFVSKLRSRIKPRIRPKQAHRMVIAVTCMRCFALYPKMESLDIYV